MKEVNLKTLKSKFFDQVRNANNILISAHINPDGDAVGSSFGLALVLQNMGKNAKVIKNDDYPSNLDFMQKDEIYYKDDFENIDLFIALDSADMKRLGTSVEYFEKAVNTSCIDHHITNDGYADVDIILDKSSTCEILAEMLTEEEILIPAEAASYLYLGILTDTFRFNYEGADSNTLRNAAKLLDFGADKKYIHDNLYERLNPNLLVFEGEVIKNSTRIGDKIIAAKISKDDVAKFGLDFDKIEGLVSVLRTIDGIEVSAIVLEDGENQQKLSFRSQSFVDVSKIAKEFGGGGHVRASGATVVGGFDQVFEMLLARLEKLYEDGDISSK